jgi:dipeptidyl aminopeptidase/acylaminoacyl peptidase
MPPVDSSGPHSSGHAVPLTAEAVVDSGVPSALALSPDGRRVVFVVTPVGRTGDGPGETLWIADVDGQARPLTAGTAPRWTPDSRWIHFLSDGQLRRVHHTGGPTEVLTAWKGGITGHLPAADLVVLIAPDEPTPEDERRTARGDDAVVWGQRPRLDRVRLLDPRTGRVHTPDVARNRHVVAVARHPDDGLLALLTWPTPDLDHGPLHPALHLLDPTTGTARDLGPAHAEAASPTWWRTDTGSHLAYLATTPPGLVAGTAVFDLAVPDTGSADEHHNLTATLPACPTELVQVDHGPPLALVADGLDTTIHRLDPTTGHLTLLTRLRGYAGSFTTDSTGDAIAAVRSTAHHPKDVHAGPPHGPLTRLSDTSPHLRHVHWGTQERLAYTAPDGLALDGLLILPPGTTRADGPFPLITLLHGGPYDRWADQLHLGWYPCGQWLATDGHAVFLPNPRGGKGHGHAFAATAAGAVGTAEWTDVTTGIDQLVADGVADPDHLGITGWSHGGFLTAWAVGHTDRFRAALVGAGISDWGMLAATGELGPFEAALGGSTGWDGPGPHHHDLLSPISHASRIRTPVLIVHGEDDTNVPLGQARYLHRALRHFGVDHDFVVYPREPHAFREREHQLDLLHRTRAWFRGR